MRVGCGSATIGIFAQQWLGHADEVMVVDDHITGVLTEHQAGRCLGMRAPGSQIRGRNRRRAAISRWRIPGTGWGGTDIPIRWRSSRLRPGSRVAGPAAADGVDDRRTRRVVRARRRSACRVGSRCRRRSQRAVARIGENCEPSLAQRAVYCRRGRQSARGRDREPGAADARDQDGSSST